MRATTRQWALLLGVDALLTLLTALDALTNQTVGVNRPFILTVVVIAAVALRRLNPTLALLLGATSFGWAQAELGPAILMATFAARARRDVVVVVAVALAVVVNLWPLLDPDLGLGPANAGAALGTVFAFGGSAALGRLWRTRAELRDRYLMLERSQSAEQLAAVAAARTAERTAMAREMHDVVSHQVSLIAMHAGALRVSSSVPETVRAAELLRTLAVQANEELRGVLEVLRTPGDAPVTEVLPTLLDVPGLCRRSGLDISLVTNGDPTVVHGPTQRACYRIVQEALTNAGKHAQGAPVRIEISCFPPMLHCVVSNRLGTGPGSTLPSAGNGLPGIEERVVLMGGRFSAGPTDDQQWVLEVSLPC